MRSKNLPPHPAGGVRSIFDLDIHCCVVSGVDGVEDVRWALAVADDAHEWCAIAQGVDGGGVCALADGHDDACAGDEHAFAVCLLTEEAFCGDLLAGA